jgi:hypothetical protein
LKAVKETKRISVVWQSLFKLLLLFLLVVVFQFLHSLYVKASETMTWLLVANWLLSICLHMPT